MTESKTETRIACAICGAKIHHALHHLGEDHPKVSIEEYKSLYPDAPLMSPIMAAKIAERSAAKAVAPVAINPADGAHTFKLPLHEVFGLGDTAVAMGASGNPIMITCFDRAQMDALDLSMVPDIDPNYVFNIDVLRTMVLGTELNIPTYMWGHAGTGKTSMIEQIMARMGRPMIRVQHTANMEESHVLGQYLLRDGATVFEDGPLKMAMDRGWVYLGDEYDFGRPEVLSVYQPVLEGKALLIKEADLANRVTKPHPMFRFFATGNTNGTGDETGLYQGTLQQNAANYERFGLTEMMPYMNADLESRLVSAQGGIPLADARKLVDFAGRIRGEYESGKLSNPISPRTLIYAAKVGKARANYRVGIEKSFTNRLSTVDREVAGQLAQRIFGA